VLASVLISQGHATAARLLASLVLEPVAPQRAALAAALARLLPRLLASLAPLHASLAWPLLRVLLAGARDAEVCAAAATVLACLQSSAEHESAVRGKLAADPNWGRWLEDRGCCAALISFLSSSSHGGACSSAARAPCCAAAGVTSAVCRP